MKLIEKLKTLVNKVLRKRKGTVSYVDKIDTSDLEHLFDLMPDQFKTRYGITKDTPMDVTHYTNTDHPEYDAPCSSVNIAIPDADVTVKIVKKWLKDKCVYHFYLLDTRSSKEIAHYDSLNVPYSVMKSGTNEDTICGYLGGYRRIFNEIDELIHHTVLYNLGVLDKIRKAYPFISYLPHNHNDGRGYMLDLSKTFDGLTKYIPDTINWEYIKYLDKNYRTLYPTDVYRKFVYLKVNGILCEFMFNVYNDNGELGCTLTIAQICDDEYENGFYGDFYSDIVDGTLHSVSLTGCGLLYNTISDQVRYLFTNFVNDISPIIYKGTKLMYAWYFYGCKLIEGIDEVALYRKVGYINGGIRLEGDKIHRYLIDNAIANKDLDIHITRFIQDHYPSIVSDAFTLSIKRDYAAIPSQAQKLNDGGDFPKEVTFTLGESKYKFTYIKERRPNDDRYDVRWEIYTLQGDRWLSSTLDSNGVLYGSMEVYLSLSLLFDVLRKLLDRTIKQQEPVSNLNKQ